MKKPEKYKLKPGGIIPVPHMKIDIKSFLEGRDEVIDEYEKFLPDRNELLELSA